MFCFGLVTVCQGLVQNYSGLLATRFFLGLAESGMFPGRSEPAGKKHHPTPDSIFQVASI